MKIISEKKSKPNFDYNSKRMRIEFNQNYHDSSFANQFEKDLDLAWDKIGLLYFWHIGIDYVEGFFIDVHDSNVSLDTIIENTKPILDNYKDKIETATFTDIN